MGGKVAAAVAGRRTLPAGLLKGLVLVAPAPPSPTALPSPSMREQQIHAFDKIENAETVIRTVLTAPRSAALTAEVVTSTASDMVRGNKWAKAAWPTYGMAEDIRAVFNRIDIPVLVIAGEKDIIETANIMQAEVLDRLGSGARAQSSLVVVEGSGHLLPIEKPMEVAQSVNEFARNL